MIISKLGDTLRHTGRALMHPVVASSQLREPALPPPGSPVPGNAGSRSLSDAMQARSHGTRPDWRYFVQEGQAHLQAGRLADAQVFLEQAQSMAGNEPAVLRGLAELSNRRYHACILAAERHEAKGNQLEAHAALAAAASLQPSAALRGLMERLDD